MNKMVIDENAISVLVRFVNLMQEHENTYVRRAAKMVLKEWDENRGDGPTPLSRYVHSALVAADMEDVGA